VTVPVASDTARALSILGICFGAANVARARERRLEAPLSIIVLDELAHPVAQARLRSDQTNRPRRSTAVSAADCRTGDVVLLLVMA